MYVRCVYAEICAIDFFRLLAFTFSINRVYQYRNNIIKKSNIIMQQGPAIIVLLIQIALIIAACVKISRKNRGAGYYVLAILFPLIGFIVACCLNYHIGPDDTDTPQPPTYRGIDSSDLDITRK